MSLDILVNDLLEDLSSDDFPKPVIRVLWKDPVSAKVACINIWSRRLHIEWYPLKSLEYGLDNATLWNALEYDPYLTLINRHEMDLTEKQLEHRNRNYEIIRPIVEANDRTGIP